MAAPNEGTDNVSIFLNKGRDGYFPQHQEFGVGNVPSSIFGEDFDNDGDQDLATADIASGTVVGDDERRRRDVRARDHLLRGGLGDTADPRRRFRR